jgi:aldehyde dehydrogenase (NAD+)
MGAAVTQGESGDAVPVGGEDPATEELVGTSAEAGTVEVDAAVDAAVAASGAWVGAGLAERVAVLTRWLTELRRLRELLVETAIAEVGAPRRVAEEAHVDAALAVLEGYLSAASSVVWEESVGNSLVLREPIGVAACITPWNYPLYQAIAKVGGALVAGCTVVLKPAELTPLSAYLLADAALAAGLPAGVLNLVPGAGRVVGEALAAHPGVDLVSFTGSTAVGARVSAVAAPTIKKVALELGGKSASVVLPDADLPAAVTSSVEAAMLNSGQTCSATKSVQR